MKVNSILLFLSLVLYTSGAHAHTFTGMVGFYDGLSHPVLGIDHFLAMVSVGIVSAQIGGRAIWTADIFTRVPRRFKKRSTNCKYKVWEKNESTKDRPYA